MLIPDVNILVYAHNAELPAHAAARQWWEATLAQERPIGLAWACILGFIRLTTRRGVFARPATVKLATGHVRRWLTLPQVQILSPGPEHADILFGLLDELGTAGNLTTDAHLAALAIEYQAELVSTDADFARFPRLRWFNPLE